VTSGTCAIEPPPAPTERTLTLGTLIGITSPGSPQPYGTSVWRSIVGWPCSERATSVEVPPMSKVRMFS
jgi:hypothetical protein